MSLKDAIRAKICRVGDAAGFSQQGFIRWAKMLDKEILLMLLEELHVELEEEAVQLQRIGEMVGSGMSMHYQLRRDWSQACASLLMYYRERK